MSRPLIPFVHGNGFYPSRRYTPLVHGNGLMTENGASGADSVEWVTVSGTSPLSLPDAAAYYIKSLIQTGKTEQDGTPLPSAPVDIMCNNGAIGQESVNPEVLTIGAQTASAADLYAVGNYADTQDIVSGDIVRNVGVKVFDGTESGWMLTSGLFRIEIPGSMRPGSPQYVLCTHFTQTLATNANMPNNSAKLSYVTSIPDNGVLYVKFSQAATISELTAFLAEQYAAGTPVIMLYPLNTAQIERVARQSLATANGENVVTITANVSSISISAEYAKPVEQGG